MRVLRGEYCVRVIEPGYACQVVGRLQVVGHQMVIPTTLCFVVGSFLCVVPSCI